MSEPLIDRVIAVTAEHYGYDAEDLLGIRREAGMTHARHVAMYVLRETTAMSYPEIGRVFKRDHSTVMHAVRKVHDLVITEPGHAAKIERVRQKIWIADASATQEPARVVHPVGPSDSPRGGVESHA